jgi:hypothetical protein
VEDMVEPLISVRRQLDRACDLLTNPTPDCMDACIALLETAATELAKSIPNGSPNAPNRAALEDALSLRNSFSRAFRLLQHAADFHRNWTLIRGAMTGGYTPRGDPAPVVHLNRICVEG